MENIINIKEPSVIAIDNVKKAKFNEVYQTATKVNNIDNTQTVNQEISPIVAPVISTPAEILASELADAKVEQNTIVEPTIPLQQEIVVEPTIPLQQEIVVETVKAPIINEVVPNQKDNINQNINNDKPKSNDLNNEIVLRIINNIVELQRNLDLVGEDVIALSNLYQKQNENKKINNEIPTNTPNVIIDKPEASAVDSLTGENLIEQPILNEVTSPFNIGNGTNIFDQPQQGIKL